MLRNIGVFSSTGQRPEELMWWHVVRRPSSVNIHLVYGITSVNIVRSFKTLKLALYQKYLGRVRIWDVKVKGQGHSDLKCDFLFYTLRSAYIVGWLQKFHISVVPKIYWSGLNMRCQGQSHCDPKKDLFVYCTSSFKLYQNLNRFQIKLHI